MSARSARRTRRRRWRMGRDIAGEREMRRTHGRRVSGLDEAPVVEGEQRRLLLRFRGFLPLPVPPTADWIIWTAAAAAPGQTITRTTDEANLFIHGDFGHFEFEFKKGTYRSKKIFLLIRWSQSTHRSLSLKGLVKKVNRAFIVSVGKIQGFSSVAQ